MHRNVQSKQGTEMCRAHHITTGPNGTNPAHFSKYQPGQSSFRLSFNISTCHVLVHQTHRPIRLQLSPRLLREEGASKATKITSFAQKSSKKQSPGLLASKKDLSTKLSAASAVSKSKVVKKNKLSSTAASSTGSSNLQPPSPIKKGVAHPTKTTDKASNKRVQVSSPHREPSGNNEQFPPLSPKAGHTSNSPLVSKKLDYRKALESGTDSSVASSSSEDTMEKMLSEEIKKDKEKVKPSEAEESGSEESSSGGTMTSEHKRHLRQHWKELKAEKAAKAKANSSPSVETVSSTKTKSIESPPRNRSSTGTATAPEDWENLGDEPTSSPASNIEQLSPLRASAPSFEPNSTKAKMANSSKYVTASDYDCDMSCPVTSILENSHDHVKGYLAKLHNKNQSFLTSPNQGPFQINYEDGEFIILNCTGSQVATLPDSITDAFPTDQAHSLDSSDLGPNETDNQDSSPSDKGNNSRERRRQRRQQVGRLPIPKIGTGTPEQWLDEMGNLPTSALNLLYEQVMLDYPRREIIETSSAGISGTNYECSLERYKTASHSAVPPPTLAGKMPKTNCSVFSSPNSVASIHKSTTAR